MYKCFATAAPVVKGDKLGTFPCSKNKYESDQMKSIPYASVIGSLMYAQVCIRPDIAFITGLLGRFQTNPGLKHWEAIKKVLRYLQGTKNIMLTYRKSNELKLCGLCGWRFKEIHVRLHIHPRWRSYIMKKLQTNYNCIVDNTG
jgi:hypothetical protein